MKIFLGILLLLSAPIVLFAQAPGCPSLEISAGPTFNNADTILCTPSNLTISSDVFHVGYTNTYVVSSIPYAPPYPFTSGTAIPTTDDDKYLGVVTLPFNFCFFGQSYDQLVVGTNGIITFDLSNANTYCPWNYSASLPSTTLPKNAILGAYHDIHPGTCGNFRYGVVGSWPCRAFIMNFDNVCHYSCSSIQSTLQIVLYEGTNVIEVHILNKPTCSSWNSGNCSIGIQNATGTVAYVPPGRNTGPWTAANEAWRFTPGGGSAYSLAWFNNGTFLSYNPSINVFADTSTVYYATVSYEQCDGTTFDFTDSIHVWVGSTDTRIITNDSVLCAGEFTTLTASGADAYVWSNGSTSPSITINPTTSGYYSLIGDFMGHCQTIDSIYIDVYQPPTLSISAATNIVCIGDSLLLSAVGNANDYLWSTGTTNSSFFVHPVSNQTYTVTGTNIAGCQSTANILIYAGSTNTSISTADSVLCFGETTALTASGANNYLWNDGSTNSVLSLTPSASGYYSVTGTFMGQCSSVDSLFITVNPIPLVAAYLNPASICEGDSSVLSCSGAQGYSWSFVGADSSYIVSPIASTNYTVTGTSNGCSAIASAQLTVNPIPQIVLNVSPTEGCVPKLFHLSANINPTPNQYQWTLSNGIASNNPSFDVVIKDPGTYDVHLEVFSAAGCFNSVSEVGFLTTYPVPISSFTADSFLVSFADPTVNFIDLSTLASTYFWEFGDHTSTSNFSNEQNPSHTFTHPGEYFVWQTVYSDHGCSDTSVAVINVYLDISLYIPNAITPYNNDGLNDVFRAFGVGVAMDPNSFSMRIFDRWGNLVFESFDFESGWDGTYKGKLVPTGVYNYIVEIKFGDGLWHLYQGNVTVMH